MRKKNLWKIRIVTGLCLVAMSVIMVTGCSKTTTGEAQSTANPVKVETSSSMADEKSAAQIVKVTKVDSDTITAEVGAITLQSKGENSTNTSDSKEDSSSQESSGDNKGTPPQGGSGDKGTPPQGGSGDKAGGPSKGAPGDEAGTDTESSSDGSTDTKSEKMASGFTGSGDTIEFEVSDSTKITVELEKGSSDGTIDDIETDSILEVVLDSDNNATTIVVKYVSK